MRLQPEFQLQSQLQFQLQNKEFAKGKLKLKIAFEIEVAVEVEIEVALVILINCMENKIRVATDIGGTFTDLVSFKFEKGKSPQLQIAKSDTTPEELEKGIFDTLELSGISLDDVNFMAHGTTAVINTITERKGCKTALITTKGFKDVLEIARSNRPDLFNFNFVKQAPFVPRYLRFEVEERMTYEGKVHLPLQLDDLKSIAKTCKKEGVESIAICLLHAYKNPSHEKKVATALKKLIPDIPVICSHVVNREWREYERTSSTVLSAYVLPLAKKYLDNLNNNLQAKGLKSSLFVMQSNGGISTVESVKTNPITLIESGPASGIIGAAKLGEVIGKQNLIVLDIGGTTAKCSLIKNGEVSITTNYKIEHNKREAGYPVQTPVIDIVEIGNGGGSIAWVDAGNKIHVGPKSAGAAPGPASYGRGGTAVTTTDANLFCGRIHEDFFLNGKIKPDQKSLKKAFAALSKKLKLSEAEIANGVLSVANSNMINALKLISINRGHDPRDFSFMVIGGGGAMHGVYLANELNIPEVIVPMNAGVFSALGMLLTDLRKDILRTEVLALNDENIKSFNTIYQEMEQEAIEGYKGDGFKKKSVEFEYYADLRYRGQEHYVKLKLDKRTRYKKDILEIVTQFHEAHFKKFTFQLEETPIEWVNFHIVAKVEVEKPVFPKLKKRKANQAETIYGKHQVDFGEFGQHQATVYLRDKLTKSSKIKGPAIIVEASTTTVLPPSFHLTIDDWGNLIIKKQ